MGIPRYAKTLATRYPLIIGNIRDESDIPPIDNLYIDLNSIIHDVAHGNKENLLAKIEHKSNEQIYEDICNFIKELVLLIRPSKFLMISADGVEPLAKLKEQIRRKFVRQTINESELINNFLREINLEKRNNFDTNEMSPCTDFSINLDQYLNNFIEKSKNTNEIFRDINILYSGIHVPGEGEFKIMEEIREEKINYPNNSLKYCIYSNDSDFILLSLLIHEPNIVILKEDTLIKNENKYNFEFNSENMKLKFNELIYISVLREYLDIEFCQLKNKLKFKFNMERIYDDFVFICLLLGNDFIPGVLILDSDGNNIEILLNSYKNSISKCENYLTENGKINYNSFKIFLNELSTHEANYLELKYETLERFYQIRKKKQKVELINIYKNECETNKKINSDLSEIEKLKIVLNSNSKFVQNIIEIYDNEIDYYQTEFSKDINELFFYEFIKEYEKDKYDGKKLYYIKKFKLDIEDNNGKKELKKIISNYLEGLQWNLFYFKGYVNWYWSYNYDFTPLISDLSKFDYDTNSDITNNIIQQNTSPLPPYISQILISLNLLRVPKEYKEIERVIPNYLNKKITFDNNGFPFPHQYTAIIPKIDTVILNNLIEIDLKIFKSLPNFPKINSMYNKEYLYNDGKKEYKRKKSNSIFNEQYLLKNTDIIFPSIERVKNYKYIEGFFKKVLNNRKVITINSLFINLELDNKKYKSINKLIINNILKEKIISFGYPLLKLGILTGFYHDNKYYFIDNNSIKERSYQDDYEDIIKKDYEYFGLKLQNPTCFIELIPIKKVSNEIVELDYNYKYLVPLEITSANLVNNDYRDFIKLIYQKYKKVNFEEVDYDIKLAKTEKEMFLFDESLRKNKKKEESNQKNDKIDKNKKNFNKNRKNKKPLGPIAEKEILNFKFKNDEDIY